MKILWLTNIPSPYRVSFFNEIGKYIELTVLFERANAADRDINWKSEKFINFNGVVLQGFKVEADKAICLSVLKWLVAGIYDFIIVSNPLTPTGMLSIEMMNIKKIPFIIEGDGGFAKNGRGLRELVKRHIISSAKYWFSSGQALSQYYLAYGAKKEAIYLYPFTSIMNKDIVPFILSASEKKALREKKGVSEDVMILSVGQFIYRKGFDLLIEAARYLPKNYGIYLVGGNPPVEYVEKKKKYHIEQLHFLEFTEYSTLTKYYRAADLFVLPTREDIWGLVINEAMANGLPIITTHKCGAGIDLVGNDNGRLIKVDDVSILVETIQELISNELARNTMAERSLEKIKNYTIEKMASEHCRLFELLNTKGIV